MCQRCIEEYQTKRRELSKEVTLKAIVIYCTGVKNDFPETKVWMDNIISLAQREGA